MCSTVPGPPAEPSPIWPHPSWTPLICVPQCLGQQQGQAQYGPNLPGPALPPDCAGRVTSSRHPSHSSVLFSGLCIFCVNPGLRWALSLVTILGTMWVLGTQDSWGKHKRGYLCSVYQWPWLRWGWPMQLLSSFAFLKEIRWLALFSMNNSHVVVKASKTGKCKGD